MPGIYVIDSQALFASIPIAMGVKPRLQFGTETQQCNRDGEPLWTVQIVVSFADAVSKPEVLEVTVPGADPSAKITCPGPVQFRNLRLGVSQVERRDNEKISGGRPYFAADDVRSAIADGKPAAA